MRIEATKDEVLDLCGGDFDRATDVLGIDPYKWGMVGNDETFTVQGKLVRDNETGRCYVELGD